MREGYHYSLKLEWIKGDTVMSSEVFAPVKVENSISLAFHPSYSARKFGVDYGKRYYSEPLYRVEQDRKSAIGYYAQYAEYGMGSPSPEPCLQVGMQPLDFMNAAIGGRLQFGDDEPVWTPDKPLSHVDSVDDIEDLGDIDWENHLMFIDLFRQVEEMKSAHPDLPISGVQGVWQDGDDGSLSFLVMHTPYTTAFRLVGERILEIMMLDEVLADAIIEWLMRQYASLWRAICGRMGWRGTKIHFGDCAATMMSPRVYERYSLPLYQRLMEGYEGAVLHSCGPSSHLLDLFAQVPKVRQLQLGDGTDLKKARSLFPNSSIIAYFDPGKLMSAAAREIEQKLWLMAEDLSDNFVIVCDCADPLTPEANVKTFLDTGRAIIPTIAR